MTQQALFGLKVLDLTHYIAGPYCTKMMADLGADVIKVEKPGEGDPTRRMGPFPNDEPHSEKSLRFLHLNTNKKGITLNLGSLTGQKLVRELVKDMDILVESFRPGVMARWGLDYETLEKINPKLVMGSISNFGQYGPYRDFKLSDALLYAMGGDMYMTGIPEREPVKIGVDIALYQAGSSAAPAILAAWLGVKRLDAPGQQVDISLQETMESGIDRRKTDLIAYQYCGHQAIRIPMVAAGFPAGVYPSKDGYFDIAGGLAWWNRVVAMMGDPALGEPPWDNPAAQMDAKLKEEFETKWFYPWVLSRTKYEAWQEAQKYAVMSAPLNTTEDLLRDTHLRERNFWVSMEHPVAGQLTYCGGPFRMAETPHQWAPAPLLGQHNKEVYGKLGYTKFDLVLLRQQGVI